MFGMLDYRAYKLLWLITRPFILASYLTLLVCIFAGIAISEQFAYPAWARIIIAYAAFEAVGFVVAILWHIILWMVRKMFFWTIDVVPAEGRSREEAMLVATNGPIVILGKKFSKNIDDWRFEDTDEFTRHILNWRARLFFNGRRRLSERIWKIQQHYWETNQKPDQIPAAKLNEMVGHLDFNWIERAVISPHIFRSMLAAAAIIAYFIATAR